MRTVAESVPFRTNEGVRSQRQGRSCRLDPCKPSAKPRAFRQPPLPLCRSVSARTALSMASSGNRLDSEPFPQIRSLTGSEMNTAIPPNGVAARYVSRSINRSLNNRAPISRGTDCPPRLIALSCCLKSWAARLDPISVSGSINRWRLLVRDASLRTAGDQ